MRFITLATTAIIAATATAQEASDTLASIKGAREITVTRSQEGLHAVVEGSADDPAYYYEYTTKYSDNGTESGTWTLNLPFLSSGNEYKTKKKAFIMGGEVYAGSSIPTGDTPMSASFEIGLSRVLNGSYRFGTFSVDAGLGFGYVQYAVGGMGFDSDRQHLVFVPYKENSRDNSSRLRIFRVHVPVTLTCMLTSKVRLTAGAWFNLNFDAWASSFHTMGDIEEKHTFKHLHQRILTTDAYLCAGYRNIGIYARYCPQSLFRNGWGPDFESVSVGLTFNL